MLIRLFVFVLGLSVLCNCSSKKQHVLIDDGVAYAAIIVTDNPPPMVQIAAGEMQHYLREISGVELPITTADAVDDATFKLYIGTHPLADDVELGPSDLPFGAFIIRSVDNGLVLLGDDTEFVPPELYLRGQGDREAHTQAWDEVVASMGTTNGWPNDQWGYPYADLYRAYSPMLDIWTFDKRGSLHAVHEFLRRQGVRWFSVGELGEVVPQTTRVTTPDLDIEVRPTFDRRQIVQANRLFASDRNIGEDEIMWQLRLGTDLAWDHAGYGTYSHGTRLVIQRDSYKAAHPEHYALYDNMRATNLNGTGMPNLGHPEFIDSMTRYAQAVFDIYDTPVMSAMPADALARLCECEYCVGQDTPELGDEGKLSNYVWGFVNQVAMQVQATHPGHKISNSAYATYREPPSNISRLAPNVSVVLTQKRRDFWNSDVRDVTRSRRARWQELLSDSDERRFMISDAFRESLDGSIYAHMPAFYPDVIADDLRSLDGVSRGEFLDLGREASGTARLAVVHLNVYVTTRLWWDADRDIDELLSDYYDKFYGPAADDMRAFIEYASQHWMHMDRDAERIHAALALLDTARDNVPSDTVYRDRIEWIASYMGPLRDLAAMLDRGRGGDVDAQGREIPLIKARVEDASSVTIDGTLDEPAWNTTATRGLNTFDNDRGDPSLATDVTMMWDEDTLYIGVTAYEPDMDNLHIGSEQPDDPQILDGDVIEVLLETQGHSYYHLAITPNGQVLDRDCAGSCDASWTAEATVSVRRYNDRWVTELAIPMTSSFASDLDPSRQVIGIRPTETMLWHFNIGRQRVRGDAVDALSLSPTFTDSLHTIDRFARLTVIGR